MQTESRNKNDDLDEVNHSIHNVCTFCSQYQVLVKIKKVSQDQLGHKVSITGFSYLILTEIDLWPDIRLTFQFPPSCNSTETDRIHPINQTSKYSF